MLQKKKRSYTYWARSKSPLHQLEYKDLLEEYRQIFNDPIYLQEMTEHTKFGTKKDFLGRQYRQVEGPTILKATNKLLEQLVQDEDVVSKTLQKWEVPGQEQELYKKLIQNPSENLVNTQSLNS